MMQHRGLLLLCALLMPTVSGCAKDFVTGKKTYNFFQVSDDIRLGKQVMKTQLQAMRRHEKQYDSDRNIRDLRKIEKIVGRIAEVSHYPKFPYKAHLADLPVANAWCAPGGQIMVYEGLWDSAKGLVRKGDDHELAAVLGHELAHATARHVTESLSRNLTIMTVAQAAVTIIGTANSPGSDLFRDMVVHGVNVYIPSYSRKNEREADTIGLTYMAKAGYDPRAAVRLWERAAKRRGNRASIYASHPESGERAKNMRSHLPEALKLYTAAKKRKKRIDK